MTVLVTGGAGFLGSHLCDRLIKEGKTVICLDDLSTGSAANIAHLREHQRFSFVEHDILHPANLHPADLKLAGIYNLACPASPPRYQSDPVRTLKINVIGTLNLLELAKKHDAVFFQASTSEVYGDPDVHPQPENYLGNVNSIGPRACYDEGKRCAETLCFDFQRVHGLRIKIVRIFNTYGPRMSADDGRVVSNFIVQALRGQNLTIYGSGLQTRSFCYVDDLIDGFWRLMNTPDAFSGPVNIGNPVEFTMLELASEILELAKSHSSSEGFAPGTEKAALVYSPLPVDDPKQRRPNITLAHDQLGWQPHVSLREGLIRTIPYFAELLSQDSHHSKTGGQATRHMI